MIITELELSPIATRVRQSSSCLPGGGVPVGQSCEAEAHGKENGMNISEAHHARGPVEGQSVESIASNIGSERLSNWIRGLNPASPGPI